MEAGGSNCGNNNKEKNDKESVEKQKRTQEKEKKKPDSVLHFPKGRRRRRVGPQTAFKLPFITPVMRCRLKVMKMERMEDWLVLEEEFLQGQLIKNTQDKEEEERKMILSQVRGNPMGVYRVEELFDEDHVIVKDATGNETYLRVFSIVDKNLLEPNCTVLVRMLMPATRGPLAVIGVLPDDFEQNSRSLRVENAPTETFRDIGGLESEMEELIEAVELPLTRPELFAEMGIPSPKGVILYGPPGTGKTLLAKAIANKTSATFLRVVGSELIQKHAGQGPKMVRDIFRLADYYAPSILFLDEIDAVGTKRGDGGSAAENEVQRTMLELLTQLDGFDARPDIKVIMATNQIEKLDPALIRPGRIDRKIEIPLPTEKNRKKIFALHTERMNTTTPISIENLTGTADMSGADIRFEAICTEAGLLTLRERRFKVNLEDFRKATDCVVGRKVEQKHQGMYL